MNDELIGQAETDRDPLDTMLHEIPWSSRVANIFNNANICTLRDLTSKSAHDLFRFRNFGKKSLDEVQKHLSSRGLNLIGDGSSDIVQLKAAYDKMAERMEELRRELIYQDERLRRGGIVTKTNKFDPMTIDNQIEVEFKNSDGIRRGVYQFVREGKLYEG